MLNGEISRRVQELESLVPALQRHPSSFDDIRIFDHGALVSSGVFVKPIDDRYECLCFHGKQQDCEAAKLGLAGIGIEAQISPPSVPEGFPNVAAWWKLQWSLAL